MRLSPRIVLLSSKLGSAASEREGERERRGERRGGRDRGRTGEMAEQEGRYEGNGGGYHEYGGGPPLHPPQHRSAGYDGYGDSRSQFESHEYERESSKSRENGEFVRGYGGEEDSSDEAEEEQGAPADAPAPMADEPPEAPAHAPEAPHDQPAQAAPWTAEHTMETYDQLQRLLHTLRDEMHTLSRAHDVRLDALHSVLEELRVSHSSAMDAQTTILNDILSIQREILARLPPRQDS